MEFQIFENQKIFSKEVDTFSFVLNLDLSSVEKHLAYVYTLKISTDSKNNSLWISHKTCVSDHLNTFFPAT